MIYIIQLMLCKSFAYNKYKAFAFKILYKRQKNNVNIFFKFQIFNLFVNKAKKNIKKQKSTFEINFTVTS